MSIKAPAPRSKAILTAYKVLIVRCVFGTALSADVLDRCQFVCLLGSNLLNKCKFKC